MPISDGCEMHVVGIAPNMSALGMAGCEHDSAVDCMQPDDEKVGALSVG